MDLLIGINGFMGAGKDTLGKMFMEIDPFIQRVALADEVKLAFAKLFGIKGTKEQIISRVDSLKNNSNFRITLGTEYDISYETTVRHALQIIGTDIGRDMWGEDHWVNLALKDLPQKAVITDVRFANECHAIKSLGGKIIRIHRDSATRAAGTHASEMYLSEKLIDFEVLNNWDIDNLKSSAKSIYNRIMIHGS